MLLNKILVLGNKVIKYHLVFTCFSHKMLVAFFFLICAMLYDFFFSFDFIQSLSYVSISIIIF